MPNENDNALSLRSTLHRHVSIMQKVSHYHFLKPVTHFLPQKIVHYKNSPTGKSIAIHDNRRRSHLSQENPTLIIGWPRYWPFEQFERQIGPNQIAGIENIYVQYTQNYFHTFKEKTEYFLVFLLF